MTASSHAHIPKNKCATNMLYILTSKQQICFQWTHASRTKLLYTCCCECFTVTYELMECKYLSVVLANQLKCEPKALCLILILRWHNSNANQNQISCHPSYLEHLCWVFMECVDKTGKLCLTWFTDVIRRDFMDAFPLIRLSSIFRGKGEVL